MKIRLLMVLAIVTACAPFEWLDPCEGRYDEWFC